MHLKALPFEIKHKAGSPQKDHRHDKADRLRGDGGDRSARGTHIQRRRHQHNVQHHIDNRRDQHKNQRVAGIAHTTQHRTDTVVAEHKNGARHTDVEIPLGFGIGFRRCGQCVQHRLAQQHHHRHHHARDRIQAEHGADGALDLLLPSRADKLGDHHGAAHRQTADEVDDQNGDLAADTDRRGTHHTAKLTHDQHIRHVIQRLQQIGCQKRQRKQHQLLGNAALCQILLKLAHEGSSLSRSLFPKKRSGAKAPHLSLIFMYIRIPCFAALSTPNPASCKKRLQFCPNRLQ